MTNDLGLKNEKTSANKVALVNSGSIISVVGNSTVEL